jgi:hypothetical protein
VLSERSGHLASRAYTTGFMSTRPKVLDAKGQTNVHERYPPFFSQFRERYRASCPNGPSAGDCADHSAWVEGPEGDFVFQPLPGQRLNNESTPPL